jgi:predicted 3-demethylubiquinone-9 3-methyltransferase (glyoxalase superfamily)
MVRAIVPHLWFDQEAKEAAAFYTSLFPRSRIDHTTTLKGTPGQDTDVVSFRIDGQRFLAISAGPVFKITPSISFFLNFDPSRDKKAAANLDKTWAALTKGGMVRMPLQEYPFSKRYGWVEDRFGVNWQLILTDPAGEPRPFVVPSMMFTQDQAGRAEEAIKLYTSVFPDSRRGNVARYPPGMEPEKQGTIMFADFQLAGQWFAAMDSAATHDFRFNEAVSLLVECDDQAEIDRYWRKMSAVPASEQCGWIKDRFGVSWQIAPAALQDMIETGTSKQVAAVTKAFLPMKKIDLAAIQAAYDGARSTSRVAPKRPVRRSKAASTKRKATRGQSMRLAKRKGPVRPAAKSTTKPAPPKRTR